MKSPLRAIQAALLTILGLTGCATPELPAWDLARPGWVLHEVPAAWRRQTGAPELAGELLLATHPDGSRMVQFSKQGVPVVVARSGPDGWDIHSPMQPGQHGGRGKAPTRVLWFQLDNLPPSVTPDGSWSLQNGTNGVWILENRKSGERLEAAT